MSKLWSHSKAGFTAIELLVAAAIFLVILGIFSSSLTSGLRVRQRENTMLELQQNLRTAMQVIAQDARASGQLHVWNQASCTGNVPCSTNTRLSLITVDNTVTSVAETPGTNFNAITLTNVCDARNFSIGDIALLNNGAKTNLVSVTAINLTANHSNPCQTTTNRDSLSHSGQSLTGQWSSEPSLIKAQIITYGLTTDPLNANRTVLQRNTGLGAAGIASGIVAFDVTGLAINYGVPLDPADPASSLIFYNSLNAAATALGTTFSAVPNDPVKVYVGILVRAIRVKIDGQTSAPLKPGGPLGTFNLIETIDLRR